MISNENQISIKGQKLSIKRKFTFILGEFKLEHIKTYQKNEIFKEIEDFSLINLNLFLEILKKLDGNYKNLTEINPLAKFLKSFQDKTSKNVQFLNKYIGLIDKLLLVIEYTSLTRKKKKLEEELEISKIKHKSSELSAKTNLLDKLNEDLSKNKKEMKFLEEDFLKIKNQRNQILEEINKHKEKIDTLNKEKKAKFDKINQITRNMENKFPEKKNKLDIDTNLSNAEMIKKLRKEAKDIHYNIKNMRTKIKESQMKLNKINPKFKTLQEDYKSLKERIKRQKTKISEIKRDINHIMEKNDDDDINKLKVNRFPNIRNQDVIKTELNQIANEINRIKRNFNADKDFGDIRREVVKINKQLTSMLNSIKEKKLSLHLTPKKDSLISTVESLRKIELLLQELEALINTFLNEIDLQVNLHLTYTKNSHDFFVRSLFTRRNKSSIEFTDLTTPEKVFFAIVFYLSIHMVLNNKTIVFSNLFLHEKFNKRGSLFRTFRKSISLIDEVPLLKEYSFILFISKLPMKKPIDNKYIEIINFKE